jgi:hypothetical protein
MRIADDFLLGIYSIFTVYLRRIYRYIFDYSLYFPTLATVLAATHLCWVFSPRTAGRVPELELRIKSRGIKEFSPYSNRNHSLLCNLLLYVTINPC